MSLRCLQSSFDSIRPMVWEEKSFEELQDGHLAYLNGRILAILNLCVTVMLPIKFWLNPTYGLGGDVIWRISRWRPWRPPWISERYCFSNSESLCCSNASHQVLAQSHLRFGRRCHLKYFKMAAMAAILDIWTERVSQFCISVSLSCFPSSFSSIQLSVWGEMSFEECQDGHHGSHLRYRNGTILAILNLCITVMLPIKFWLNPTFGFGGDVVWRMSRWPPWGISERNNLSNSESLCRSDASHEFSAQSDLLMV